MNTAMSTWPPSPSVPKDEDHSAVIQRLVGLELTCSCTASFKPNRFLRSSRMMNCMRSTATHHCQFNVSKLCHDRTEYRILFAGTSQTVRSGSQVIEDIAHLYSSVQSLRNRVPKLSVKAHQANNCFPRDLRRTILCNGVIPSLACNPMVTI